MIKLLALPLALALVAPAPAAQIIAPGYDAPTGAFPGYTVRELSDGSLVMTDGDAVNRYSASGALIAQIGSFSVAGFVGALVVDPTESFVIAGNQSTGEMLRVDLGGAGQSQLGFLPGNHDAAFETPSSVVVSWRQCNTGPGCAIVVSRLDVNTGAQTPLSPFSVAPGPVAASGGDVFYATRTWEPVLNDSSTLLRFDAADLASPPTPVYQALDNLVVVEVESVPPAGDWNEYTALTGFTGESYYRWDGPDLFGSPGSGILRYEFEVQETANYKLRIHNRHDDPQPDQDNDCWVRVDGGPWWKVFSNSGSATVATWNWISVIEQSESVKYDANYDLDAGRHVIEMSGRSNGFMIDRFIFYQVDVPHAFSLENPQSVYAPFNESHLQTVTGNLAGALELVDDPETGDLFVAERSETLGLNRIRRIQPSTGALSGLVEGVPGQLIKNLSFRPQGGSSKFLPFQPAGNGTLGFTRQEFGSVSERRILTPERPTLDISGPGSISGTGMVNLALAGGPPSGFAFVLLAPETAVGHEFAVQLPGLPPLVTGLNPGATTLIATPVALDHGGGATVSFFHGLGAPDLVGLQAVVLSSAGAIQATSTTTIL